jgi:lysophospholipase L1-like esterase
MKKIKIVVFNIIITFALLGAAFLAPPILHAGYKFIALQTTEERFTRDGRSMLSVYDDFPWAQTHFKEFASLPTSYFDFVTWRRDDFKGETINIQNGIRVTAYTDEPVPFKTQVWFFGGSTTWGTGVTDEYTYPSLFARTSGLHVKNFGESGYIARQSAAFLINRLISENLDLKNVHVVFYDGVNDVEALCRKENKDFGTTRQGEIRRLLDRKESPFSFSRTFSQLQDFIAASKRKFLYGGSEHADLWYTCASDERKALQVAQRLVETWQVVSALVEGAGGKFTAILQPVAFYGEPKVNYLAFDKTIETGLSEQFAAVFPEIVKLANSEDIDFLDLTYIYDDCSNCYIDYCHVGPLGHEILVETLFSELIVNESS